MNAYSTYEENCTSLKAGARSGFLTCTRKRGRSMIAIFGHGIHVSIVGEVNLETKRMVNRDQEELDKIDE